MGNVSSLLLPMLTANPVLCRELRPNLLNRNVAQRAYPWTHGCLDGYRCLDTLSVIRTGNHRWHLSGYLSHCKKRAAPGPKMSGQAEEGDHQLSGADDDDDDDILGKTGVTPEIV